MLVDYHIHSHYVGHAKGTIAEICQAAIKKGIKEICITEHKEFRHEKDNPLPGLSDKNVAQYFREIGRARELFDIPIKIGIEIGYDKRYASKLNAFVKAHEFDYVIGSIHYLEELSISSHRLVLEKGADIPTIYRNYYKALADMAGTLDIDCIGHMDVVKKKIPPVHISEYKTELLHLFDVMKKRDIGFELNTSGWSFDPKMCYPDPSILALLHKAGIRKVTLGSDAHNPSEVGAKLADGIHALKKAGFREICTFTGRVPKYVQI